MDLIPNYKMTQVEAWTLSVQQQLRSDLIFEINYSGTAAHHLPIYQNANRFAGDLIVNNNNPQFLNPSFGAIEYGTSNGNSVGHVGSAVLTRRMSHGFSAARHLFLCQSVGCVQHRAIHLRWRDHRPTPTSFNRTISARSGGGRTSISASSSRPTASGLSRTHFDSLALRNILGGWQVGGVWILQTGLPFTVTTSAGVFILVRVRRTAPETYIGNTGGDYNADGTNYDVPNVPSFGRHLSGKKKKDFLDGVFGPPAPLRPSSPPCPGGRRQPGAQHL